MQFSPLLDNAKLLTETVCSCIVYLEEYRFSIFTLGNVTLGLSKSLNFCQSDTYDGGRGNTQWDIWEVLIEEKDINPYI